MFFRSFGTHFLLILLFFETYSFCSISLFILLFKSLFSFCLKSDQSIVKGGVSRERVVVKDSNDFSRLPGH